MALERYFLACKNISILKIYMTRTSGDRKEGVFEGCLGLQTICAFGIDISEAATSWCWFSFSVGGYNRWIDKNEGFGWEVGDQRLLYRAAEKTRICERSFNPPPLISGKSGDCQRKNVNEPVVAFGPPGS
ncbi:PREDICTED: uncharacterized protein LOC105125247 [Populus euphratica]|uniref:Uncharacterized protein LOC105125247 n=1 Tax=Populus euphratica TaxID=75702 RepID=A0AAJ6U6X1_POPEU|nr:PREDICTED: uncharacterized protein LOC105125247 [Populus euphratica]